jgi:predicted SAM-dependent methyltransferase
MGKTLQAKKINLGCGTKLLKGFINVDIMDFAREGYEFVRSDVRKLPFKDNYADYILAYQVLEHIPIWEVAVTLAEWRRVLKPGGRMVVTCPNFDHLVWAWINEITNKKLDQEKYLQLTQHIYGNQMHEGESHKTPMTPQFLNACMSVAGFKEWKCSVFEGATPAKNYPGIDNDGRLYAVGQVHIEVESCDKKFKAPKRKLTPDNKPVSRSRYSQHNEEELLEKIFKKIGTTNKYFVEFGCHRGGYLSNTYLLKEKGWVGHWIDSKEHPAVIKEKITPENVNEVFKKLLVPQKPDLVSIDIDGMDYWVWKALKYQPRVILIEYNPLRKSGVQEYKEDWIWTEDTPEYGASKEEMIKLGKVKGYKLIAENEENLFFERR